MAAQIISDIQIVLAGIIVLVLPGFAWQAWFRHAAQRPDPAQRLAEAVGMSLAGTALVALAAYLAGIHFNAALLIGVYAALALLAVIGLIRQRVPIKPGWPLAVALLAVAGGIAWRLYQAQALALPAWVDSVHHVLIVKAMLEQGGLPSTLSPYLPVPFYYHYGFHVVAAVFAFWSGLAPERAVLVIGQVLNAAIGLAIYRLGMELWSDVRRAGAAALLATFAFTMPAYYLTWGRYPLSAGLVVLPLVVAAALRVSRQARPDKETLARLALLTGGLFLVHYLTAILLALFLVCLGVSMALRDLRLRSLSRAQWTGLLSGVAIGCVLALPWLLRIVHFNAQSFQVDAVLSPDAPDQTYYPDYLSYLWYLAGPQRNYFLLLLAGLGLLLAIRRRVSRLLAAWAVLMLVFCSPWGLKLGPFRPDHMVIVLFLPGSLLAADLLVSASEAAGQVFGKNWNRLAAPLVILGLCFWGERQTANILNPSTLLADAADVQAINWVKASTPANARFFINSAAWQGPVYRGVDGGWWLLPLTGRWTVVPPVVYTWGTPEYVSQLTAWARQASQVSGCTQEFWNLVREANLDYVYLRLGKGALQPQALEECPGLEQVYQSGGVWIYQIMDIP